MRQKKHKKSIDQNENNNDKNFIINITSDVWLQCAFVENNNYMSIKELNSDDDIQLHLYLNKKTNFRSVLKNF